MTRRCYLLGRDRLLGRLALKGPSTVLEVGCGTGRNLIQLARVHPEMEADGVDASSAMLEVARRNVATAGLSPRIRFHGALAEELRGPGQFGRSGGYDAVIFSYSLSMIPDWRAALAAATPLVRSGGCIGIADFFDQRDLPPWFRRILRAWLRKFHTTPRDEMLSVLETAARQWGGAVRCEFVARRYAVVAVLTLPP